MTDKLDPDLVAYIKAAASGPLLTSTVHTAVLEADARNNEHCSVGGDSLALWKVLKAKYGWKAAHRAVCLWIDKPYQLPSS